MNNRYIIDLLEEMKHNCLNGNIYDDPKRNDKVEALNYAIFCVERQLPIVDAEPVKHAKWEWFEEWSESNTDHFAECEDCGWRCGKCKTPIEKSVGGYWDDVDTPPELNYCPNCGAKCGKESQNGEDIQN